MRFPGTTLLLTIALAASTSVAEQAPQKVHTMATSVLPKLAAAPAIISAIKAQNAQNLTLDEIKQRDTKWRATPGYDDFMKALQNSACSKHLQTIQKDNPSIAEVFVMDNKGANVAMADKTSDYWQGDEDKFKKAFADAKGALFVDEVEFDDSTQRYLVQVSLPIKEGAQVIGTITFGIDIDALN
jgi:ABC-type branched-subunit amino acid transport system substrate-binding protein